MSEWATRRRAEARWRLHEWLRMHGPKTAREIAEGMGGMSVGTANQFLRYLRGARLAEVVGAKDPRVGSTWRAINVLAPPSAAPASPPPPPPPTSLADHPDWRRPGLTGEDLAYQEHWCLPRAERRRLAAAGKAPPMVSA